MKRFINRRLARQFPLDPILFIWNLLHRWLSRSGRLLSSRFIYILRIWINLAKLRLYILFLWSRIRFIRILSGLEGLGNSQCMILGEFDSSSDFSFGRITPYLA